MKVHTPVSNDFVLMCLFPTVPRKCVGPSYELKKIFNSFSSLPQNANSILAIVIVETFLMHF